MSVSQALAAHRFGFGPQAGRLPARAPAAQVTQADKAVRDFPLPGTLATLAQMATWRESLRGLPDGSQERRAAIKARQGEIEALVLQNARMELARAVGAEDSYRERLVRFWADHFTVKARQPPMRPMVSAMTDDAIRPHVTARFAQMLRAAVLHPAMLGFLDQVASVGPDSAFGQRRGAGLNENLARELLELHTLGVEGGYTQADVRQTALLLTGLAVNETEGTVFQPRRAEPGAETVLGRSYGSNRQPRLDDIHQLLDDLAAHPTTVRHLCGKLAVHFVSDTPDPGLVADLVAVWTRSDGDLKAVSQALAEHPAAERPVLEKARQPFDFVVAALRALGVTGQEIAGWNDRTLRRTALLPMRAMGQPWQEPNGPDGWEEGFDTWITPQALAIRIDWGMNMPSRLRPDLPDARDFVRLALADLADDDLVRMVSRAERNAEGVGLVLAAPLFNRR
ncbi:MAG: DUF1800 family protein [Gemmobacter sp.]|uniref:DUF1800 domain-containing protein n=1 Tax=Gemmobacter sp. TaxID=1898957 RepID=UPI00391A2502